MGPHRPFSFSTGTQLMVTCYTLSAAILWAFLGAAAEGQELTTDAERDWKAIRNSEDVRTKVMAERWYNAVRQQDWSDTSGKFKVSAKYVAHDPKLAWVKLRVFRGTGKERQVKDVQIPLDKLSKTCQARVRTISVLAEKIATAKEDEAEKAAEAESPGDPNDRSQYDEPEADKPRIDSGPMESGLAEMDPSEVMEGREGRRSRGRERAADRVAVPTNAGSPLPAALPPLPTTATAAASTPAAEQPAPPESAEAVAVDPAYIPPLDAATPYFPDSDPWRMDYEEFRTAFEKDPDTGTIATPKRWAGVLNLQLFTPPEYLAADPASIDTTTVVEVPRLAEIGDFQWQGSIVQPPAAEANWAEVLGLAPLPAPLKLELRLQGGGRDGAWQQLNSREPVRFVGRFIGYRGPYTWVAEIRLLPNDGSR
jgi:hypothetical protein